MDSVQTHPVTVVARIKPTESEDSIIEIASATTLTVSPLIEKQGK